MYDISYWSINYFLKQALITIINLVRLGVKFTWLFDKKIMVWKYNVN